MLEDPHWRACLRGFHATRPTTEASGNNAIISPLEHVERFCVVFEGVMCLAEKTIHSKRAYFPWLLLCWLYTFTVTDNVLNFLQDLFQMHNSP